MPAINIVDRYVAVQYNGSNKAEVAAIIADYSFVSEGGGTLEFTTGGSNRTVNSTEWVRAVGGNYSGVFADSFFAQYYSRYATYGDISGFAGGGDLADLTERVEELESSPSGVQAAGIALAPTLLLGASATVPVNLSQAMPDTSYTPHAQLIASTTALGSLSVTGISVVDTDTVNVTVQNSGLVNLSGVQILVTAST